VVPRGLGLRTNDCRVPLRWYWTLHIVEHGLPVSCQGVGELSYDYHHSRRRHDTVHGRPPVLRAVICRRMVLASAGCDCCSSRCLHFRHGFVLLPFENSACSFQDSALMLSKLPYYWPNEAMGHSQPIATRSGWIAIAIMPFMMFVFDSISLRTV
jgi:hypothetical protein